MENYMSFEDLPIDDYEKRIEKFKSQTKEDMCLSTCITNILNDLGRRQNLKGLRYRLSKMNKLCDYKEGLQCNERIIPSVMDNELAPYRYRWAQEFGPQNNLDLLKKITLDPRFSLPIVSVSSRYFEEIDWRLSGKHTLNHVLIVMAVNHKIVYFYDPYENYFKKKGDNVQVPRIMTKPVFLNLWDEATMSRWVAWVEPVGQSQIKDFTTKGKGE